MRTVSDQLAKRIGYAALGPCGQTVVHDEIHPDAQHADLRHEPDPTRGAERERLGLLGRMAAVPCLIEVYGHPPGGEEFRACLGKHIAFWQQRVRAERKERRVRRARRVDVPVAEPFLWIVTAGCPSALLRSLKFEAAAGWPSGVQVLSEVLRVGVVVATELPRERSTLLVRLMAAGPLLADAIKEVAALPADAHERAVASRILLSLLRALEKKAKPSPLEQEIIVSTQDIVEQLLNRGRREGRQEGRQEGQVLGGRRLLHRVLAARNLAPTEEEAAHIEACEEFSTIEQWIEQAMTAPTVADALRPARTRAARRPPPGSRSHATSGNRSSAPRRRKAVTAD